MSPGKILYRTMLSNSPLLLGYLLSSFILSCCGVLIPWLLKDIIDITIESKNIAQVNHLGIIISLISIIMYCSYITTIRLVNNIVQNGIFTLRKELYSRILWQPLSFSRTMKTGELMHYVQQSTAIFEQNIYTILLKTPFDFFLIIGILSLMFKTNILLLLCIVVFLITTLIIAMFIGDKLLNINTAFQKTGMHFNAKLHDIFNGIRIIKSFGREQEEIISLDKINQDIVDLGVRSGKVQSLMIPLTYLMEVIGIILVIWLGAHLIIQDQLSPGMLVAFLLYVEILAEPVSRTAKYFECAKACQAILQQIGLFIHQLDSSIPPLFRATRKMQTVHSITLDNVCFKYNKSKHPILNNISFVAKEGEILAVIGKNGVGKSTLMDLILGLQKPDQGQILINKTPIFAFNEHDWRRNIGVLSQDTYLFNDTIEHNIAYGKPDASVKDIENAAMASGLQSLLTRLPDGLQTKVGERGGNLSGGEKQKIAIARLILQNPQLIIFDEPSTHLDNKTIDEFLSILKRLSKNRIIFLIEHRSDIVIRIAQKIILIDSGKIVAMGNHTTLLNECALYKTFL